MKIQSGKNPRARRAFTLLEVMFAVVAFFSASFAILALVSNSLRKRAAVAAADGGRGRAGRPVVADQLARRRRGIRRLERLARQAISGLHLDVQHSGSADEQTVSSGFHRAARFGDKPVVAKMSILLFRPAFAGGQS